MSYLDTYCVREGENVRISAAQGSRFAKEIARDFNPLHDVDSRRFCIPGDLLFALCIEKYGINRFMRFRFQELVKADSLLRFDAASSAEFASIDDSSSNEKGGQVLQVLNQRDKSVLQLEIAGQTRKGACSEEQLVRQYVRFSGQNFPNILVPLMRAKQTMFNPQRPMVVYEQMSLRFEALKFESLSIKLAETRLDVHGKRGTATLEFNLLDSNQVIGKGSKVLLLSGLRPYNEEQIDEMRERFRQLSANYHQSV